MLGNLNFGTHALGTAGPYDDQQNGVRNYGGFKVEFFQIQIKLGRTILPNTGEIEVELPVTQAKLRIEVYPTAHEDDGRTHYNFITEEGLELYDSNSEEFLVINTEGHEGQTTTEIEILAPPVNVRIINRIRTTWTDIEIEGFNPTVIVTQLTPTTEQYIEYLRGNFRTPIYRLELLRKEDESVRDVIEGAIVNNSGSIQIELDEGVRRTCDFTLANYDGAYNDFIENITLGDKFRISLGYRINGVDKYFPQGVFVFDDPSIVSGRAVREIAISGTDKWSMLNGQSGGILEGTYTVEMGSTIGDLVRRTLHLNIVNDPIEPLIDSTLENQKTTYDITKSAGDTISDVLLEVALNVSAYAYYDENGRFVMKPIENDIHKAIAYSFSRNEYNYLEATKSYNLSEVYNSVVVIGDNIKNSETPIVYEAINNDLSDPNSVPNTGLKKVKQITEYTKGIDTMEKAMERANYELKLCKNVGSSVEISCLALYHLDVDQAVILEDDRLNADGEKFIINSIELPIGVDVESSIELYKASELE